VCRFVIDDKTGAVSVGVDGDVESWLLDRESDEILSMLVIATDGHSDRQSTAELIVQLADVNDNAPIFDDHSYVAEIDELSLKFTTSVSVTVRSLRLLIS